MAYAYAFVPLGLAVWTAHYLFHFLIGAFTIVPALQQFFARTIGLALLGQPNWQLATELIPSVATADSNVNTTSTGSAPLTANRTTQTAARALWVTEPMCGLLKSGWVRPSRRGSRCSRPIAKK